MGELKLGRQLAGLAALRANFTTSLPGRLSRLQACWLRVESTETWGETHDELLRQVHSLAGSAGTFGYRRVSEKAKELELILAARSSDPGAAVLMQRAVIADRIDALTGLASAGPDESLPGGEPEDLVRSADGLASNSRQIMLIADDVLFAEEVGSALSQFGWDVAIESSDIDSQNLLSHQSLAAIIVDIDVGIADASAPGVELVRQYQSHAGHNIPLLLISARSDWTSRLEAVKSGAAGYLTKPIDVVALNENLDRVTRRRPAEPYRVLIVDDDEPLAKYYSQVLEIAGLVATSITDPAELLDAMAHYRPEIVIMDLHMPTCSGFEALAVLRQDQQLTSVPVVFLSGETGVELQQQAMQAGAEDFLHKSISDSAMVISVRLRAERFRAVTNLIRQDSLTGLLSNLAFQLRLEGELDRRSDQPVSVVMLDIDHFKSTNDTYGHSVGDRVLRGLAGLLQQRLRHSDIVARYGGDEFVVAMPNTLALAAVTVMDEIRQRFSKMQFDTPQGSFSCTISCGVAGSESYGSAINLGNAADIALYRAKELGRNRVELFVRENEAALGA